MPNYNDNKLLFFHYSKKDKFLITLSFEKEINKKSIENLFIIYMSYVKENLKKQTFNLNKEMINQNQEVVNLLNLKNFEVFFQKESFSKEFKELSKTKKLKCK